MSKPYLLNSLEEQVVERLRFCAKYYRDRRYSYAESELNYLRDLCVDDVAGEYLEKAAENE